MIAAGAAEQIDKPSLKPSIRSATPAAISVASFAMEVWRDGPGMGK